MGSIPDPACHAVKPKNQQRKIQFSRLLSFPSLLGKTTITSLELSIAFYLVPLLPVHSLLSLIEQDPMEGLPKAAQTSPLLIQDEFH